MREKLEILEHHTHTLTDAPDSGRDARTHLLAFEHHAPVIQRLQPVGTSQQRGLA